MDHQAIAALEHELSLALNRGDDGHAARLWDALLHRAPDHPKAVQAVAQRAFREGDLQRARQLFERLVELDGSDQQQWINLAVVCIGQRDAAGEERAIRGALTVAPSDLMALLLKADMLERRGQTHAAAAAYGAAASVAPPFERLRPDLHASVARARAYKADYDARFGAFLEQHLATQAAGFEGRDLGRFRESLDIMLGRKKRYESQSMLYHYPGLAARSFFERADFPWLDAVEAATDAIRSEFLQVLASEQGFEPYLRYDPDQPLNQWAELNNSPRWSALHLYRDGVPVPANAGRCPATMAALSGVPMPDQPGRTPTAMFSLLKPRTRIPPHVGVSNARLVTHLPLIVPAGCGFRVGNDTRSWEAGKAWVFDDTIEHEAWNDSEQLRVVLIFDIWHPHLNPAERAMITAMSEGIRAFAQEQDSFSL